MKYNSTNKPLECMMTQSTCYKGTTKMQIKGILWHSTGTNNTWLKRYVQPDDNATNRTELLDIIGINKYGNDWNHIQRNAGLNAWIGKLNDGTVATIQTMPWDYRPWGCGKGSYGSCNDGWIQFEICEDNLKDINYFNQVYQEACELTAYLCEKFNIDPLGTTTLNGITVPTILCHSEAHSLGVGSNHSDVMHWFSWYDKTMAKARDDVKALIAPSKPKQLYRIRLSATNALSQKGAFSDLEKAKSCCQAAGAGYHVFDSAWNIVYSYVAPVVVDLTHIEVTQLPKKTVYKVGEEFDSTGLIVTATYSDGSKDEIEEYTLEGFDSSKVGTYQIRITFTNCITVFDVTIEEEPQTTEPELIPIDPNPGNPEDDNEELMNKILKFFRQMLEAILALFKKELK